MATPSIPLTQDRLKQVLDYNPETGVFTWKFRPDGRSCWNTRFAGKEAGGIDWIGYVQISVDDKRYRGHRLAWLYMTGSWPYPEVDHKDMDKSNNAWTNLREATRGQNKSNRTKYCNNKSGLKGVSYHKATEKWCSRIMVGYKAIFLGYRDTPIEAHELYCEAAQKYHGKFARTE